MGAGSVNPALMALQTGAGCHRMSYKRCWILEVKGFFGLSMKEISSLTAAYNSSLSNRAWLCVIGRACDVTIPRFRS